MRKILLTTGLLSFAILAFTQAPKLSVAVSSDTVLLGNHFELKFTIENASMQGFEAPSLHEFDLVSGPNTSSSISIVNGQMSQSASMTYYLHPPDIGVYTIKPAYLTTEDAALETPPIDIIVMPNPEGVLQRPHSASKRFDQLIPSQPEPEEKPSRPRRKF